MKAHFFSKAGLYYTLDGDTPVRRTGSNTGEAEMSYLKDAPMFDDSNNLEACILSEWVPGFRVHPPTTHRFEVCATTYNGNVAEVHEALREKLRAQCAPNLFESVTVDLPRADRLLAEARDLIMVFVEAASNGQQVPPTIFLDVAKWAYQCEELKK